MKSILLAVCIIGVAICAPQMYMEFDIHHAPAQAAPAIPAGAPVETLEVLLPVDAQRMPLGGPVQGFIKQEVPLPGGTGTEELFYPFGFADAAAPAAPVAPVAPVAPAAAVAPAAPAAPAAPVDPIVAAPKPSGDDDEEEDD